MKPQIIVSSQFYLNTLILFQNNYSFLKKTHSVGFFRLFLNNKTDKEMIEHLFLHFLLTYNNFYSM